MSLHCCPQDAPELWGVCRTPGGLLYRLADCLDLLPADSDVLELLQAADDGGGVGLRVGWNQVSGTEQSCTNTRNTSNLD